MVAVCPVLVVDDDPAILETVADILTLMGYPVDTAAGGAEALDRLEHTSPAVLLLDMRMPGVSGWDVAHVLQAKGRTRPRVVVMTAAQDAQQWADEVHAHAYLAKPFDLPDLLSVVEGACAGFTA